MAPTTAAERQRQYRARINSDPERRAKYLKRERQRWKERVETGKEKSINELTPRQQRAKRKSWRNAYKRSKERKEVLKYLSTPPLSPEDAPAPPSPEHSQNILSRQHVAGKKSMRKKKYRLKQEIEALQQQLKKERKRSSRYKKRYQRLKKMSDSPRSKVCDITSKGPTNPQIRKMLLFHHSLIADIKSKYQRSTKEKDRQLIAKIARGGKIIKKYKLQRMAEESLGFSFKRWKHEESLQYERKKKSTLFAEVLQEKVKKFYVRDDVSRITTGTKQTLTRNKIKKQKRFMLDTVANLHRRFLSENSGIRISYSFFCRLRPFWVVNPTISERDTCMCKLHENLAFVAEKLHQLRLIETANLENLLEKVCCDSSKKDCMYGECEGCRDKLVPISLAYDSAAEVSYTQWVTEVKEIDKKKGGEKSNVKVTIKKSVIGTQETLTDLFHSYLQRFRLHHYNIKQQYAFSRELKKNMKEDEALIHIDFSENYCCKYSSQIQAVHFGASHQQATLHTGVLYLGGQPEPMCFSTISPCRHKSPPAIWQHLYPVLDYLKTTHPQVSVLHFLSDGPCTQYKQRGNFFLFSTELYNRGFMAGSWNFFEASHGKGAPDGVGGALKRRADMMVAKGRDIPDAQELYNALIEANTTVKLFFVKSEDVENAMEKMPKQIPAVPGIMKIHQVITLARGELLHRDVSCLCTTKKQLNCTCIKTQRFSFDQDNPQPEPASEDRQPEKIIQWYNPEVIGKWCMLRYDEGLYPGIILATEETHVQVQCMHQVGKNRFFWPGRDDIHWYPHDDVLELIPPPQPVTKRHVEILKEVWDRLSK